MGQRFRARAGILIPRRFLDAGFRISADAKQINKKAETPLFQPSLHADKARFELAEGFALTRFRGVLLRPLGHLSIRHLKTSNLIIVPQWWRLSNRTGCNGVISGVSCFAPDCASLDEQRFVEGRIAPIKRQFDTVRNQTGKHAQGLRSRIRRLFCIGDA